MAGCFAASHVPPLVIAANADRASTARAVITEFLRTFSSDMAPSPQRATPAITPVGVRVDPPAPEMAPGMEIVD